jgi:hypothetical protein
MKTVRTISTAATGLVLLVAQASGQTTTSNPPATLPEAATNRWSFSASAYTYLVPHSRDYVDPILTANRGWLHLEARYNYESLETGSAWLGYKFSAGTKLALELTPMLGGVFGNTTGVAPACNLSLSYRRFALSSQGEYVFDTGDRSGNFAYTWSELSYSPVDWFRAGVAVQRTKAYTTDLDLQRGVLVGFLYKKVNFTTYVFNLGWTDPTVVLAVGVEF